VYINNWHNMIIGYWCISLFSDPPSLDINLGPTNAGISGWWSYRCCHFSSVANLLVTKLHLITYVWKTSFNHLVVSRQWSKQFTDWMIFGQLAKMSDRKFWTNNCSTVHATFKHLVPASWLVQSVWLTASRFVGKLSSKCTNPFKLRWSNNLSLDPTGKTFEGISTNSVLPTRRVSQFTSCPTTLTLKHRLSAASFPLFPPITQPPPVSGNRLTLTGGSFETPMPVPSVFREDALTAWGTSGALPRPRTQLYVESLRCRSDTKTHSSLHSRRYLYIQPVDFSNQQWSITDAGNASISVSLYLLQYYWLCTF